MSLLDIKDLKVSVEDKVILEHLDLNVNKGEVHVIMGPNGAGKSTLASAIVGNPAFEAEAAELSFEGEDLLEMEVYERARKGIFLSFQVPEEIPGLQMEEFLRTAKESVTGKKLPIFRFHKELLELMKLLHIPSNYASRHLNVGFSGGEKKKSEILQLAVLAPKLAILDETDSGLDIDATKIVFEGVTTIRKNNPDMSILIITHHNKVLDYVKPDFVHVLIDGKIVKTGGFELVQHIEEHGYEKIKEEIYG